MGRRGPRGRNSKTSDLSSVAVPPADQGAAIAAARERVEGDAGQRFFGAVVSGFTGWSPAELELLVRAAQATDRVEEARDQIRQEGIVIAGARGDRVKHPALAIERAALAELRALLKHLRLEEA